jgi:hypothetical protein
MMLMAGGNGVALPYSVDFSQSASLPAGWVGSAATIAGGKMVITPNKGADLITNGNFANWAGDNPNNWTLLATENGSNYVTENPAGQCQIIATSVTQGVRQTVMTLGKWYEVAVDCTARTSGAFSVSDGGSSNFMRSLSTVASYVSTGVRVYATDGRLLIKRTGNPSNITVDNFVTKLLTDADLYAYYNQALSDVGSVKAAWVIGGHGKRAGVVGWWDKAAPLANCLVAIHDGISEATLIKYVGTTPTVLIDNTAATYVAGASVEIRKTAATTFQLWYNGSQVGIDQTVSDAGIISNQYFGVFGTHSGGQCVSFYLNP